MEEYERLLSSFSWDDAREALDGLPGGRGLNMAHEAVDRHVAERADQVAIRWLGRRGEERDLTYRDLAEATGRFASALAALGLDGGHGVATLLGRVPELYIAALGTLKGRGVYTPLFSAFGPEPVAMRLGPGRVAVLVTTAAHYRRKVAPVRDRLEDLRHIVVVGDGADDLRAAGTEGVVAWEDLLAGGDPDFTIPDTDPQDRALLHFTSGTTGRPKGAIHVHEAVVAHAATGRLVLDLRPGTRYWCTADPGWVTGTSYGMLAPLVNGVTAIVDEADFDGERWYRILQDERIDVFYTAPTALRMLQRLGAEVAEPYDLSSLRLLASVGEPLDPESVLWSREVFRVPVLDNWWQTETGAMMIANLATEEVRPGSMGRPLPGIEAGLLALDAEGDPAMGPDGEPVVIDEPDQVGELSIRTGWPSMFRGYLDNEERYLRSFAGSWYHSGDLAKRDADGYYWFVGRNNDVIKSAGHLIGPFEVESALTAHPGVVEAGVIGRPDPTIGAVVKAFVVPARGVEPDDDLRRDLMGHARKLLGPAVAPREIEFADHLPHTRSGKIMRRLLLARELGLDEGDTSTLETPTATPSAAPGPAREEVTP